MYLRQLPLQSNTKATITFIYTLILLILMEITCGKCLYKWNTKSELIKVSCPSCGHKNFIIKEVKKEVIEDGRNGRTESI